ncbi:MAG: VWA domain-containing protein [Acidimicrobiia bacterium]|nr:VWA domain-containing protein [Acidimicrobiia bacterium]
MAFLSPLFLLGALAAAIPLVLHLLRREPDTTVRFAAVDMLQHAPVEHAEKRRLRELMLLALRVAALALLAVAFARPFLSSSLAGAATGATVIALDTSYSLSAPGRFARAQQLARDAIAAAPRGHVVGVVTFADGATVVQAPSSDRALAASAVDAAGVGYGTTRYRAALTTAADAIGGGEGRIIVVTDLQASGWDTGDLVGLPARAQVEVVDVGVPPPNLALTGVRVSGDRLIATVRNVGPTARDVRLRLTVDGKPAGEAVGRVDADDSTDVPLPAAKGTSASIAVDDPEGIQADDARYFVFGESARPLVLVVTNAGDLNRDAFYTQQALLAAGADGAAFDVAGASGAKLSGWDSVTLGRHAAVIVQSTRGLDQRGRELVAEYVRRGGGVLVTSGLDVDAQVAAGAVGAAVESTALPPVTAAEARELAPADVRHPVFRTFASNVATLGLVKFRRIAVARGSSCHALARFSSGEAALLECTAGEGRVLVWASDLEGRENDFPVHATFVPFIHEVVTFLVGTRGRGRDLLVGSLPAGLPAEPGLRTLPGDARVVAVNVDTRESDGARLTSEQFAASIAPRQPAPDEAGSPADPREREARQQEARQGLWRYAILLMMAALAVESVIAARTT